MVDAGAIMRDMRAVGPSVFERFTAKRDGTLWYYRGMLAALEARVEVEPRIAGLVRELRRLVGEMGDG